MLKSSTDNKHVENSVDQFVTLLESLLLHSTVPITELALLKRLQHNDVWQDARGKDLVPIADLFSAAGTTDSFVLFQKHFMLMHGLYCLQAKWEDNKRAVLSISPLSIAVSPWLAENSRAVSSDFESKALRDYYLDISHLEQESASSVDDMLGDFWRKYGNNLAVDDEKAKRAFVLLGFTEPVDVKTLRRRYRSLAQQHHPDRGGQQERFIELNQAYEFALAYAENRMRQN